MTNRLHALTFDCADAAALGEFWAQVLEQELDPGAGKQFASIGAQQTTRKATSSTSSPRPRNRQSAAAAAGETSERISPAAAISIRWPP